MPDRYVEMAKENMGALERLFKGLPGIQGYVDKNLRRDADKRLRTLIAGQLEEQKQRLFDIQQKLLKGGGLKWLDDVDSAVQKLQILIDRIKTASYGYAGLFDAVTIREEQLDALHRFDVALAGRVVMVENAVDALAAAVANKEVANKEDVGVIAEQLTDMMAELNNMFNRRQEAILDTQLLMDTTYTPEIDPALLEAIE